MKKFLSLLAVMLLISLLSFSQNTLSKVNDSLIRNFLIVNRILAEPINDKKIINKKIKYTSNYYGREHLLKAANGKSMLVIVFGAYREHPRDYLVIFDTSCPSIPNLFLGMSSFEEDLNILSDYFTKCSFLTINAKRKLLYYFSALR